MRKAVGHNLPLTGLTRNSLGRLRTPVPAALAGQASMWADICPFSTFIREVLSSQAVLRCPRAALVHCLQNEKTIMALIGHLMAQTLLGVHGCGCDLWPVIWHWGHTSHFGLFSNMLVFVWFWLGGLQVYFWYKQEKSLVSVLRGAHPTVAVLPL